jgi:hypothetical protein
VVRPEVPKDVRAGPFSATLESLPCSRGTKTFYREDPGVTSIGFGGGEVIEVSLSLDEVRELLQRALTNGALLQVEAMDGETVVINPQQVKVLQNSGPPEAFPGETNGRIETSA